MSGLLVYPTDSFKQNSLAYGKVWSQNNIKIHCGVDVDRDTAGKPVRAIKV